MKYNKTSGNISEAKIENLQSDVYSEKELKEAAQIVLHELEQINGIYVYSVSYSGDKASQNEKEIRLASPYNETIDKCICFNASFRTSVFTDDVWGKCQDYDINFVIGNDSVNQFYVIDSGIG